MMYKTIKSFDEVNIIENSLILCDIDETLIRYRDINHNWWNERKNYWSSELINIDMSSIDNMALMDWRSYIKINKPKHTDKDGFKRLYNKIKEYNCDLILVTARDSSLLEHTKETLNDLDIDFKRIYFTSTIPKGEFIKDNINLQNYNKIVFIDDNLNNIESVYNEFGKLIENYRFIM